jgi:hypothetical protein
MQNNLAEEQDVEIPETEGIEVEPVEEQPEAEQEAADSEGKEDELEQYSESVQKRISKLTNRFREEERQRPGRD